MVTIGNIRLFPDIAEQGVKHMALTAAEAAKRLGQTKRTVRRWIEEGKLAAFHPTHGNKNKYLIEESEVERLVLERAKYEQPGQKQPGPAATDTTSLIERITALEQRVSELEAIIGLDGEAMPVSPGQATETPANLPPGSIQYWQFAKSHNVPRLMFRDHINIGMKRDGEKVEVEHISNGYWLTPDQQSFAIEFWKSHHVPFTPCPACPHELDLSQFSFLGNQLSSEELAKRRVKNFLES